MNCGSYTNVQIVGTKWEKFQEEEMRNGMAQSRDDKRGCEGKKGYNKFRKILTRRI